MKDTHATMTMIKTTRTIYDASRRKRSMQSLPLVIMILIIAVFSSLQRSSSHANPTLIEGLDEIGSAGNLGRTKTTRSNDHREHEREYNGDASDDEDNRNHHHLRPRVVVTAPSNDAASPPEEEEESAQTNAKEEKEEEKEEEESAVLRKAIARAKNEEKIERLRKQERRLKMSAKEYREARQEMKTEAMKRSKPAQAQKKRDLFEEFTSLYLVPLYRAIANAPKSFVAFNTGGIAVAREKARKSVKFVLFKIPANAVSKNAFEKAVGFVADFFLCLMTYVFMKSVLLFTPMTKAANPTCKMTKMSNERVKIQFHMPFAGAADKCIVFLKGNKLLCRCPEKMLECETELEKLTDKNSTWIIFEEPVWIEYKDELVVIAKVNKKSEDDEAKKIDKMPLKTPAAKKKTFSRMPTTKKKEKEEDMAPDETKTALKKTPASAKPTTTANRRSTRQTPAKTK